MSKLFASIAAAAAFFTTAAWADQPHPWQWRFQEAASPIMEQIEWFEVYTLWFIIPITLFVLALLAYCIWRFRESVNPTASRTSHNTVIEIIWTVAPVVVLLMIAIPSFQLLTAPIHARRRAEAHPQGDRQPVELGLRIPDRGAALVQLGLAGRW